MPVACESQLCLSVSSNARPGSGSRSSAPCPLFPSPARLGSSFSSLAGSASPWAPTAAMKKWIGSFGTNHASATPAPVAVQQPPIISAADAKTFGFENVSTPPPSMPSIC